MKILFDQGTPAPLRRWLAQHEISTAYEMNWSNLENGTLLNSAEQHGFNLLITTDQNLTYQQNLKLRVIAIIALPTTNWPRIRKNVDSVMAAVSQVTPGTYIKLRFPD